MEKKLKMAIPARLFLSVWLIAFGIVLAGCGESSTTTDTPSPTAPPSGTDTPLPTVPVGADPRLPALLKKSVGITLQDPIQYSGLSELAGSVFVPVIETFFAMEIDGGRSANVEGKVLVGFEDSEQTEGFWAAVIPSFTGASTRSSSGLDMIFADDELVVRVIGSRDSEDNLTGNIYYRVRLQGDTACKRIVYTCQVTYPYGYGNSNSSATCPFDPPADNSASICRSYMNLGQSRVKLLGSFRGTYGNWVK